MTSRLIEPHIQTLKIRSQHYCCVAKALSHLFQPRLQLRLINERADLSKTVLRGQMKTSITRVRRIFRNEIINSLALSLGISITLVELFTDSFSG